MIKALTYKWSKSSWYSNAVGFEYEHRLEVVISLSLRYILLLWNLLVAQFSTGLRFPSETEREGPTANFANGSRGRGRGEGKKDDMCDTKQVDRKRER